jgi:hypothetical protein
MLPGISPSLTAPVKRKHGFLETLTVLRTPAQVPHQRQKVRWAAGGAGGRMPQTANRPHSIGTFEGLAVEGHQCVPARHPPSDFLHEELLVGAVPQEELGHNEIAIHPSPNPTRKATAAAPKSPVSRYPVQPSVETRQARSRTEGGERFFRRLP